MYLQSCFSLLSILIKKLFLKNGNRINQVNATFSVCFGLVFLIEKNQLNSHLNHITNQRVARK